MPPSATKILTRSAAVPSPAVIVLDCPTCSGNGYQEEDVYGHWEIATAIRHVCESCDSSGKRTLHVGEVDGVLHGYDVEAGVLGTFANREDMLLGRFDQDWEPDRLSLPDRLILAELGVGL